MLKNSKIRKIFPYLKPYIVSVILAPLFMLLEVMLDLMQPMMMQRAVDVGIMQGESKLVLINGGYMFLIAVFGWFGGVGCARFSANAAMNAGGDLREALFKKVQSLSFYDLDKLTTGHIITRLTNDVTQIQNMIMMTLRLMVRAPLLLVGSIIMASLTSLKLSIVLAVVTPLIALSMVAILSVSFPLFLQVQNQLDGVNKVIQENLAGMRAIKAFVRGKFENERLKKVNEEFMKKIIKASRAVAIETPLVMLIINFGIVAVIYFGGVAVNNNNLQIGKIIAFTNYLMILLQSLMTFAMMLMMASRSSASVERVFEVLELESELNEEELLKDLTSGLVEENIIEKGKIRFENVSFKYDKAEDGEQVLDNLNFEIEAGTTTAILGSTGSGKSTLVSLIPRFFELSKGNIYIDEKNVKSFDIKALRNQIGTVLQKNILFSGTIKENIAFGKPGASDSEIIAAAKAAQAHDFIMSLPEKYETELGQRGVNLSGGQKQRIAIARALITKPKILILDDTTSAVDAETESKIQDELKVIMKDRTSIVIAQRISSVLEADNILVLNDGEIVSAGSHEELINSSEIYKDIYMSQLGGGESVSE